jgi:hypothetical protein
LKKISQFKERSPKENSISRSYAAEKFQEGAQQMIDANKSTLFRSSFNIEKPSLTIRQHEGSTLHHHAVKKTRGKYHQAKLKILLAAVSLPSSSARIETSYGNPNSSLREVEKQAGFSYS